MKCAEAKTRLSFVTATLNSLRAGIAPSPCRGPAALHQRDEDRGGGEVRRGARILRVAVVAQLGVEGLERRTAGGAAHQDRKSTRLNSSHLVISYAVFCLKKKKKS